jgi:hypothetical protein
MQLIMTAISAIIGYLTLRFASHPNSKIYKKLPHLKIKSVDLFPNIKITVRGRIIHIHHWFSFTILLCISIFVTGGILDSWLTRGFLLGGVYQGLRFPDRNIFQKRLK